jgi:hypothetical protein
LETSIKNTIARYLEIKIKIIFKDTYLHGIKEEILNEVKKIGNKK